MVDFVKCCKSFQISWNASNVLANVFKTTFRLVQEDLEWIPNGSKSADFEQKAWAIAHGFENGEFVWMLESFETSWNASNGLANVLKTTFRLEQEHLEWIPNGPKSADCEHKAWAIAHGFENGGFF